MLLQNCLYGGKPDSLVGPGDKYTLDVNPLAAWLCSISVVGQLLKFGLVFSIVALFETVDLRYPIAMMEEGAAIDLIPGFCWRDVRVSSVHHRLISLCRYSFVSSSTRAIHATTAGYLLMICSPNSATLMASSSTKTLMSAAENPDGIRNS